MMDIEEIKKNNWFLFEYVYDCPIWLAWDPFLAYGKYLPREFGIGVRRGLQMYKNGDLYMCFNRDDFDEAGKQIMEKAKQDEQFLGTVLDKIEKLSFELFAICDEIRHLDLASYTNAELLVLYNRFFAIYVPVWSYGQMMNIIEMNNSFVVGHVKELLAKAGVKKEEVVEVLSVLSKFENYSLAQKEEWDIVQLAKNGYTEEDLKKHFYKYASLGYGWCGPGWGINYFKERLDLIRKNITDYNLQSEQENREKVLAEKNKIITELSLPKEVLHYAKFVERIGYLKGLRIDASFYSYLTMEGFFKLMAKKFNLSYKQVLFILPDEMRHYLATDEIPEADKLNGRMKLSAFVIEDDKWQEFQGQIVEEFIELVKPKDERLDLDKLSGETGNPGQAVGVVKVIHNPEDFKKMNNGDILVSHATDPRYVPIMKMAAAIVADVGGVTCHASIVSRELNIPCVIGTKIATRVLQDGDRVEVDATNGIIKKI